MENLEGTLLKGYKLEARIGNGGFGAVYRARQPTVGREVAVKIILPGYANNPDFIRRFESEAHLIARLEHPHITPLHDFWRDPEGAYLVMRYLRGGSVRDSLQTSTYELHAVSQLLDQIASALDFAHRNNVIHRDIKPGNILLDEDGNAYLADFGIAKDLAGITDNKTAVDAVVGSLDYISPEQARSEPVTPRTDIYSLGVTLYEMITGEHPFRNASTVERLYKHINDPLPEIITLPEATCEVINEIIGRATAKNPEDRYPDVLALAVAFREAIGRDSSTNGVSIVEQLTMREQEVLSMIAQNMSNREIADTMVVTLGTVKWHITQLYKKLGVRSRVQAIVRARELNLIVNGDTTDNLLFSAEQPISISLPEPENPYKGLHAFQMTDARDFFGRDDLTTKLVDKLCDDDPYHRFLAIVGPSGSGKSSLVKAGLIPALWKGAIQGSEKWFVVDMIPGTHPLDKLETALIRVAANQTSQLREQLQRNERGLLRVADIILPGDDTELVIVVDQFEEVFTLGEDEQTRQHFLDLLRIAVSDVRSRVRVVVTLRADYYDRPLHYPEFGELIRNRMETLLPLTAKGLERAVRGPAERVGVTFEQGLVEQIVSQMNYQAGALPLLQYALTELFDRREGRLLTNEAYQKIGGAVGALANRADEIYRSLTENGQELAHQMFMRLVTLGEGAEDTRRRALHAELLSLTDNTDLMEEVIDQFAAYRLLSLDHDPETRQPTVEVAHEAILREWDRLRQWLNESRDDIRQEQAVARAADEWNQHNQEASYLLRGARLEQVETWQQTTDIVLTPLERDFITHSLHQREQEHQQELARQEREGQLERRSRNFLRGLVAVFAISTIIAAGLSIFALNQRQLALDSAAETQNVALVAGSQAALTAGDTDQAIALALQAVTLQPDSATAQTMLSEAAYSPGTIRIFEGHTDVVASAQVSPDGQTVLSGSWDNTLILWDIGTGEIIRIFEGHQDRIKSITFMPDGKRAVSGSDDATIILWDVQTGEPIMHFTDQPDQVWSVAVSPDGNYIASGGTGNLVRLWDVETGQVIRTYEEHTNEIEAVRFSPDGQYLLSTSRDLMIFLWDVETGEVVQQYKGHVGTVFGAAFSADGTKIASCADDGTIILWDLETGALLDQFHEGRNLIDVTFSQDNRSLISAGVGGRLQFWDIATGQMTTELWGHQGDVHSISLFADGRNAITAGADGHLRLWELEKGQHILSLEQQGNYWSALQPSPDGLMALTAWRTYPQTDIVLTDLQTGEDILHITMDEYVEAVAFSPDGRTALLATDLEGEPSDLVLWDTATGEELSRFRGHPAGIYDVEFSPNGEIAASGGYGGALILWDIRSGQEISRLQGYESTDLYRNYWVSVEFSPDGKTLVATHSLGSIVMWDINTGQVIREYEGHSQWAFNFVFTENGLRGLSGSGDTTSILWDVSTAEPLRVFEHTGPVTNVDMRPDGRLAIAGVPNDGGTVLRDLSEGQIIRRYGEFMLNSWFLPDGERMLVGNWTGPIEVWRLDETLDELVLWTQTNRYTPELTCEQRELYRVEPLCETDS